MKNLKFSLMTIVSACLLTPAIAQADSFTEAVQMATASIDKAKAANYEWRDSRKMLSEAEKLNKSGQKDKALELVDKAKKQGEMAVAQAKVQSSVTGPH